MLTVVHREALKQLLYYNRIQRVSDQTADPSASVEDIVLQNDLLRQCTCCIQKLPPLYQRVIGLRYGRGLSFREVGDMLGKSEQTVRQIHCRAIHKIRQACTNV